ncbi:MAG: LEA type 2 family protein [Amphritea sp.]|nr:LEA type 2 family protein [Amphritea sp.]
MSRFQIKNITKQTTDMDLNLLIDNPLPVSIKLDKLSYKILIGATEIVERKYPDTISIKSNDKSLITLPIIIKNEKLLDESNKLKKKKTDTTEYRITGDALVSFLLFKDCPYYFDYSKNLPLYIVPEIEIKKIKLGLKQSIILLIVQIRNFNTSPYMFKKTSYDIKANGDHLASGKIDNTITIHPRSTIDLDVFADVSTSGAVETQIDYWFDASDTEYALVLESTIVAEDTVIKDSKIIVEAKGVLKDLKD